MAAFRLTDHGLGAVDDDRGIVVSMAFRFADTDNMVPYDYTEGDLRFGFDTYAERGIPRSGPMATGEIESRPKTLVTHILESSIKDGLFAALGKDALDKVDFDRLKADICEAVFVAQADGGDYLRLVPEFRVDIVP
ncbi:hypothetical protein KPL74_21625 [Bacillus sp. NP157]|nr:hypothetical protein KPL74_21625 [Bacillus sp. NP157]